MDMPNLGPTIQARLGALLVVFVACHGCLTAQEHSNALRPTNEELTAVANRLLASSLMACIDQDSTTAMEFARTGATRVNSLHATSAELLGWVLGVPVDSGAELDHVLIAVEAEGAQGMPFRVLMDLVRTRGARPVDSLWRLHPRWSHDFTSSIVCVPGSSWSSGLSRLPRPWPIFDGTAETYANLARKPKAVGIDTERWLSIFGSQSPFASRESAK
jgi:hypothetical protein